MKLIIDGVKVDAVVVMGIAVYVKPVDEDNGASHAVNRANERAVDPKLLSVALARFADEVRNIAARVKGKRQKVVFRWQSEKTTIVVEVGRTKMPTVGIVTFLDVFKEHVHNKDMVYDL